MTADLLRGVQDKIGGILPNSVSRIFETPLDYFLAPMEWNGNNRM